MREWSLPLNQLPLPVLAADGSLGPVDYANDQVWEISAYHNEPLALALQTTFGLRARSMRIFPVFLRQNETVIDPAHFATSPLLHQFFPNYLRFSYTPFSGIDVQSEYWVPCSQGVCCRTTLTNQTNEDISLRMEWAVLLSPLEDGQGMTLARHERSPFLAGTSSNLSPVFMLTGIANDRKGPFPALGMDLQLPAGKSLHHTWALASLSDQEKSYALATQLLTKDWEAEIARLEMFNDHRQIEIESGNPLWDAAFALSQTRAFGLILQKEVTDTQMPIYVRNRLPDLGYSPKGDGSDFNPLWARPPALATWYLSSLIMPGACELVETLLRDSLSQCVPNGTRPINSLFSSLPAPLLATLALKVYDLSGDQAFLEEIFPGLLQLVSQWLDPAHDRDRDSFPEWDSAPQSGFEENPLFTPWEKTSPAYAIDTFESPALGALLYREMDHLFTIARLTNQVSTVLPYLPQMKSLQKSIESTWESHSLCYRYRDRDTHTSFRGKQLAQFKGAGEHLIGKSFPKPRRLQISLFSSEAYHHTVKLCLYGTDTTGAFQETLTLSPFQWIFNRSFATTQKTYATLEKIETEGLAPRDRLTVDLVDNSSIDITSLTPIWASIPNAKRAETLVRRTLLNPQKFLSACGLVAHAPGSMATKVLIPWNQIAIEGLLSYGYQKEAVDLFTRLMNGIVSASMNGGSYYHYYPANLGEGSGERDDLNGLPPVGLFLELVGVQFLTNQAVIVSGINPFSGPVTVKYHGIKVTRDEEATTVTFPDGQVTTVTGKEKQRISLV